MKQNKIWREGKEGGKKKGQSQKERARRWLRASGSLDICALLCAFGRLVSHLPRAETNPNKRSVWMALNNQMLRQATRGQLQILSSLNAALHFLPPPQSYSPLLLKCLIPLSSLPLPAHQSFLCFIKKHQKSKCPSYVYPNKPLL